MKNSTFCNPIGFFRLFIVSFFVAASFADAFATIVDDGCVTCNNVTNAGSIGVNQSGCTGFDPAEITNISSPTGGSGALEIIWVYWNASTNWNLTTIGGATSLSYNPGPVTEDTYFRRCARRAGCSEYVGESNDVFVDVTTCSTCNGIIENLVIHDLGSGTTFSSLMNGASYPLGSLPANWNVEALLSGSNAESVKFTWTGDYVANNIENTIPFRSPTDAAVLNLGVGTYTLTAQLYSQDNLGGILCDELTVTFNIILDCDNVTFGGLIGDDQSGCGSFDPEPFVNLCDPSGGSGALEIIWMYKNESTGWNWVVIADANGLTYDSGPVSETTVFIRCARRNPCESYTGESNEVTVTITGPCCFYTVYDEQFNQSNGTTSSSTFTSTYSGSHTFSVQSGKFKGNDTDVEGVWTSSLIDIAGQGAACISLDLSEEGGMEAEDYIKVYYKLDGGANVAFPNGIITDDFTSTSLSICGLSGSTLQVIVKILNSSSGESHFIDNVNVNVEGECTPVEICLLDGYEYDGGRIFWIPGYGTDFKSSPGDPLKLTKYSGGIAHISGTIERIADANQKFVVSLWFDNESTYAQWIAQGNQAHTPNLGDETTWTFYDFDSNHSHTLVGAGSLTGTTLFLENQMDIYGLQLGNGANSLNSNANGISTWFSYTGTTSGNGDINGSYDCGDCALNVDAGPDQDLSCLPSSQVVLTSIVSGAEVCDTPPVTDCNHVLGTTGGWLENSSASTICDDAAGTKLWTQSGQGTSFITLDFGAEVPAGTQICVNMKLEHCSNSSTSYSDAKIQASTQAASNFVNLTSSVTFSQTNYLEFCYTLGSAARYIKISDNGYCAFRVDYVEYTTPGSPDGELTYDWSGPGIVGASNGPSVTVNEPGTYVVTVTDCDGCTDSDEVVVTGTPCSVLVFHNVPSNTTVECNNVPGVPANVYASNSCDEYIEVSYSQQIIPGNCPDAYTIVRTWTAIDPCGGTSSATQTIVVQDTTDPVFPNQQSSYDLGCNQVVPYIVPQATDNCDDNVSLSYSDVDNCIVPSDCDFKTYTPGGWGAPANGNNPGVYRDANFNAAFPNDLVVGCGIHTLTLTSAAAVEAFLPAGGTPAALTQDHVDPGSGFHNNLANHLVALTLSATFDAYDPNFAGSNGWIGNGIFDSGDFAGMTISQVMQIANDVLGGCSNAYSPSTLVEALAGVNENFDGGSNGGFIICTDQDQACYCTVIRTWTATDDCSNSSTFTQYFNVGDTEGPVPSQDPSNIYVECDDAVPAIPNVTWTDECGEVLESWYCEETVVIDDCNYQIIRMWHANDGCHVTYVDQIVYVNDETAPVIYGVPADVTMECDEEILPSFPYALDNCDDDVMISLEATTLDLPCGYLFIRTWTATDNCDNVSTGSQTITVIDYTAPVLYNIPEDFVGSCVDVPEVPTDVYAIDNCSEVVITFDADTLEFSGCAFVITRTWTATDDCGNATSDSQVIIINEDIAPEFEGMSVLTVECGDEIPYIEPDVYDNCDGFITVTYEDIECAPTGFVSDWFAYSSPGGNGIVDLTNAPNTIHLTGSDNSISAGEFVDGTFGVYTASLVTAANVEICFDWNYETNDVDGAAFDPFGYYVGGDLVQLTVGGFGAQSGSACVPVGSLSEFGFATWATDDQLGFSEVTISNIVITLQEGCLVECPNVESFIRLFTATDVCGNSSTFTQVINIQDTTDPVLVGVPDDMTGLCDDDFEPAFVSATDYCDEDVDVVVETIIDGSGCDYTITYVYTATDNCGNTDTDSYSISVIDLTPPVIYGVPQNTTIECDEEILPSFPYAIDNCDNDVIVSLDAQTVDLPCGYLFIRTWTATDDCGNTSYATQTITVVDYTAPEIVNHPVDIEVECDEDIPVYVPIWTDNCDDDLELTAASSIAFDDCYTIIHQTYTATDDCDNSTTVTRNINIVDNTPPVFDPFEPFMEVPCEQDVIPCTVTATDNCDDDVTITLTDELVFSGGCYGTIYRTCTATDNCGNTSSVQILIHYIDEEAPVLHGVPDDVTVQCADEVPEAPVVTATDNCDDDMEIDFEEHIVWVNDCIYQIVRTWTVEDECNNMTSDTQVITVHDTTPPVIYGVPADVTIECDEEILPSFPYALDNCDDDVEISLDATTVDLDCGYLFIRTWTATDNCGNSTSASQTITVVDYTAPVIVNPPVDIEVECDEDIPAYVPIWTDNCDDELELSAISGIGFDDCYTVISQTYFAEDDCGNQSSVSRTINIVDNTPPVIYGVPGNVTVECDNLPGVPTSVYATDNCDEDVDLDYSIEIIPGEPAMAGGPPCGYTIIRTWIATDECDNSSSAQQIVTVLDTTAPVLYGVPDDVTVECTDIPEPADVYAIDNCWPDPVLFMEENIVVVDECTYRIIRTWVTEDNCWNYNSESQIITVTDYTAPYVIQGVPAELTIECDEEQPEYTPIFGDNCDDDLAIAVISGLNNVNDCSYDIEIVWTATDNCGNSVSVSQVIHVIDYTDPVLYGVPADVTIECDEEILPSFPYALDNCDEDVMISLDAYSVDLDCGYLFIRTWTATDNCGNSTSASQTITVVDYTAPVIVNPPVDIEVECDEDIPAYVPIWTDNCDDDLELTAASSIAFDDCYTIIHQTYTATDDCDNSTTVTRNINIIDTTPPVLHGLPDNITVECDEIPAPAAVTATDNCDEDVPVSYSATMTDGCPYYIYRTWTATDECGNTTSHTQTIYVIDVTAPVLVGVPDDVTVECTAIPEASIVWAYDNCVEEPYLATLVQEILVIDDCTYLIIRTWSAHDPCLNTGTGSQVITVTDYTAPVLTGEDYEVTLECNIAPSVVAPTATDNCDDDVEISFHIETTPGICEDAWTELYIWTAVDNCGNTSYRILTFHFQDTTPPVIYGVPDNTTIECDEEILPSFPYALDNCDDDVSISLDATTVDLDCGYLFIRTWTATDNCGNSSYAYQTITVVDTTPPVASEDPADIYVECDEEWTAANVTFTDNCGIEFLLPDVFVSNDGCTWTYHYIWTAIDYCGNATSVDQYVYVTDNTSPVIVNPPVDIEVECDEEIPAYVPIWSDNCDDELELSAISGISFDDCYTIIYQTYFAEDDCGNESSVNRTINIVDNTPPVIYGVPSNVTVECDNVPGDPTSVYATDNCDEDVDLDYSVEIIPGEPVMIDGPPCGYTIIRTWIATDECDNTTSAQQIVTVVDTTAPVLYGVPDDVTVECTDIPEPADVYAVDNCWPTPALFIEENIVVIDECTYRIIRTWVTEDNCWNYNSQSQIITVTDYTNPVWSGSNSELTLECNIAPTVVPPTATDNCDDDLTIDFHIDHYVGDCENEWTDVYVWVATDNCGNFAVRTYTFHFEDTTPPVIYGVPADVTIECDEEILPSFPFALDNCDDDVEVSLDAQTIDLPCGHLFIRTWTATDNCGNISYAYQTITVLDYTAPVIVNPPVDIEVECDEEIPVYVPIWTDNCDDELELSAISSIGLDDCYTVIQETYFAMDDCGNQSSVSRTINIIDTTPPVLIMPDPLFVTTTCETVTIDQINAYLNGLLTPEEEAAFVGAAVAFFQANNLLPLGATDNCDEDVDIDETNLIVTGPADLICPTVGLIECVFVATDDCGNQSTASTFIYIVDYTAPTLVGVPDDVTVECTDIPAAPIIYAYDDCSVVPILATLIEEIVPVDDCTYLIVRTWSAHDPCFNTGSGSQVITVTDYTNPVWSGSNSELTLECNIAPTVVPPTATDNCDDDLTIDFHIDHYVGDCENEWTDVYVWVATDNCGNFAVRTYTFHFEDTTPPVIYGVPADVTIECDEEILPSFPFALDNCDDDVEVSLDAQTIDLPCGHLFIRTWTAVDNCGNTSSASQTITVVDYTAPVIVNPPVDIEVECDEEIPVYIPVWTDNCDDDLELTAASSIAFDDCYTIIHQTYTATDDCDNSTTVTRNINIVDNTPPVFDPYDPFMEVACGTVDIPCFVTATDNCDDDVTVTLTDELTFSGGCYGTIYRTCTATDDCGNSTSIQILIQFYDDEAPVLHGVPADVTVQCADEVPAAPVVTATDNCDDDMEIEFDEYIVWVNDCIYQVVRTWTVEDECDNVTSDTQIITVHDTTPPVIYGVPADVTIECDEEILPSFPFALDNCDDDVSISLDATTVDLDCGYLFIRTWTATDDCGNTSTASQTITVVDYTSPVIVNPPVDIEVECDEEIPAYVPIWSDNCDDELELSAISGISFDDCYTIIYQTYFAEDDCGNESSVNRTINIVDNTPPVIYGVPSNVTVECDNVPGDPTSVYATDNCDEDVDLDYSVEIIPGEPVMIDGPPCGYTIIRTWIATDECDNTTSAQQIVTVVDTTAPVLYGVPDDVTVECTDIPEPADVYAVDNCWPTPALFIEENIVVIDECTYRIIRTWVTEDNCWNYNSQSQIITVTDYTNPVWSGSNSELTLECNIAPTVVPPTATDNCDDDLTIDFHIDHYVGDCENEWTDVYVWVATDNCGNFAVRTYTFHFEDTTPPVIYGVPADVTIECDEEILPSFPFALDNCDDDVEVSLDAQTIDLPCGHLFIRTWTATDNCGNISYAYQTITVLDYTAPVIVNPPVDIEVECDEEIPVYVPIWTDNCDDDLELTAASSIAFDDCYTIIHQTYTATDDCDNSTTVTRNINIVDNTPPVVLYEPADITVECDVQVPMDEPIFADNCDDDLTIEFTDDVQGDCPYTWTCTWTATDECGNSVSVTRVVTIVDTTAPVIDPFQFEIDVTCDQVANCMLTATDNCDGEVDIVVTDIVDFSGGCLGTLFRTCTAYDDCGNSSSAMQIIHIIDEVAPVLFNIPVDVTIECTEQVPPIATDVFATDNCDDEVDLTFTQSQTGIVCPYDIIREWVAIDQCLNITTGTQIIHVGDGPPVEENPCAGDLNDDGIVNLADLLILTAYYGCSGDCGPADINNNGSVNITDFLIFNSYFGLICD